ncbi:MAG: DUF4041 domain-containing protein [Pseudomonadota bacterium]
MEINTIAIISLGFLVAVIAFYSFKLNEKNKAYVQQLTEANGQLNEYVQKFSKVIDIEKEVAGITEVKNTLEKSIEELKQIYKAKKDVFDALVKQAAIYDESIELAELGFYKPHYDFDTSEEYREELDKVREQQKTMVEQKTAITCRTEWSVEGSKAKGQTMTNRGIRLTARAFNNECDAAVANARWNNAERMEGRIIKAYEAINKLNESNTIVISTAYLDLKLQEFRLAYEHQDKKQKEREEQAAIRQQMREEAKLQEESDAAIKEEERYQKMLGKAKSEAEKASGAKLAEIQSKIETLAADLAIAHEKSERAKSMAQQTRAGHVYVISNVGSFGENVYKIGMTRRLEPDERVKELGDASVPFTFDIHAMIYSTDAPALENVLHKTFDSHRLNLVNNRKEFFHASLEHIEKVVKEKFSDAVFQLTAEAREYRESAAIRAQREARKIALDSRDAFPSEI